MGEFKWFIIVIVTIAIILLISRILSKRRREWIKSLSPEDFCALTKAAYPEYTCFLIKYQGEEYIFRSYGFDIEDRSYITINELLDGNTKERISSNFPDPTDTAWLKVNAVTSLENFVNGWIVPEIEMFKLAMSIKNQNICVQTPK